MTKNHLKRLNTPKTWRIMRKKQKFITRPNPGAHRKDLGMSINTILKTILKKTRTTKETKHILHNRQIMVDGKIRHDQKYQAGFMDVVTVGKEHYRITIDDRNNITAIPIDKKEAELKLTKIKDKKIVGKNKIQLTTRDGRSIITNKGDYKTGDSLLITVPKQEIKEHLKLEKDALVYLYKGRHIGILGTIEKIAGTTIVVKAEKKTLETKKAYALVVGKTKPVIKITK
jgi:small subunit ribosomal protein S4e